MTIVLYKMNISPPTRTVLVVADILGLNIETREVSIPNKDHLKPEYVEKNPLKTIPLLEDGDFIIADSHAIIIYLISKYGNDKSAELYPSDDQGRALIHQRLFLNASILYPRGLAVLKAIMYDNAPCVNEKQKAEVEECYGFLEKYLETSSFLAGAHLTIADISIVTSVSFLNIAVPVDEEYVNLLKWWDKLKKQDWYETINQPGVNGLSDLINSCLETNNKYT